MDQIHQEKIKMKPKYYFILGSIMTGIGLISAVILTILSTSLLVFLIRAKGPGASFRLNLMLDNFPVWILVTAVVGLLMGFWLLKKYDFSYKFSYKKVIGIFLVVLIISMLLIDALGLTKLFMQRGPMRGSMNRYLEGESSEMRTGRGQFENMQKINKGI